MKKRRFGVGKWNGYGGKVLPGENIEEALIREVEEEGGIKVSKFEKVGMMDFHFPHTGLHLENHVYRTDEFEGEPIETEEMVPKWFNINELPVDQMWKDDPYWLPLLLEGKKFKGKFVFAPDESIIEHEVIEVENL